MHVCLFHTAPPSLITPPPHSPSGVYQGAIDLLSEGIFQYKFVVDGKWTYNPSQVPPSPSTHTHTHSDPSLPLQPIVDDGYGGYNNVLNTRTLCLAWNEDSEVCVAGTFTNWQPVPMQKK